MQFRMTTLNLEQDHKARRELINAEMGRLKPDMMAFNEYAFRGNRRAAYATLRRY